MGIVITDVGEGERGSHFFTFSSDPFEQDEGLVLFGRFQDGIPVQVVIRKSEVIGNSLIETLPIIQNLGSSAVLSVRHGNKSEFTFQYKNC
ncbi:MAG: hypothetical protein HC889_07790 [Synechococcaceae cyanobacterium SM1_2_3]|nr:hypothetical protein [Synechococcaceae cyanobacterium SM1_2_3]